MIKVKVKNIGADSLTGSPVLLLENVDNEEEIYPIWIGVAEAENIILHQAGIETPRPLTYDLMKSIIKSLGASVDYVAIVDKQNNIYIAEISLNKDGKEIKIDARPSDAVNLALRFNVPIYLNENVVQKISLKDLKTQNDIGDIKEQKSRKKILKREAKEITADTQDNKVEKELPKEPKLDPEKEEIKKFLENIKPEDFAVNPFDKKRREKK